MLKNNNKTTVLSDHQFGRWVIQTNSLNIKD